MKKKKCKTSGCGSNKLDTPNKQPTNGKGDKPRNLSNEFRANYESIDWGNRKKKNLKSN
jgi:hypothetical protein